MTTKRVSASALRPLAAALATLCVASASAADWNSLIAQHRAIDTPHATNRVVGDCNDEGASSLRNAITSAASGDTIDLTHLNCSKITLTTGSIVFGQANLNIVGPGANALTVDGANNSAMIYHLGVGTLRISGISITNGRKYFNDSDTSGACVHTIGDLQLDHVKVSHCSTSAGAYRTVKGGAVFVGGYASVLHSTISDSSALSISTAGGRKALGGGIYSGGGLYMIGSTISNNVASTNPRAYSYGGGVAAKGKVTIVESLISKNQAYSGGGVYLADLHNTPAVIDNSTISGNNAYIVGGVFARPEVDLYNSTIAFNTSSKWSGTRGEYAAGLYVSRLAIMQSTIIARNVNTGVDLPSADVTGASSAILLGDNNNVMFCAIVCPLRTTSEDPGLGPLLDNGGPTRTHRPTPGLWNRFGGNNIHGAQFDQRGVGFPRESSPDRIEIGAFQTNSGILFVNGFN